MWHSLTHGLSPSLLDPRFLVLLTAIVLARMILRDRWNATTGAVAAVVLIGIASLETLALIGGTMLLIAYPLALAIRRAKTRPDGLQVARSLLILGIVIILTVWVAFKIQKRFTLPFLDGTGTAAILARALGFSYFLFRFINFLYMHYLVDIPERSPARAMYYALFPPTITSGPIHKYLDFRRELETPRPAGLANLTEGCYRITKGYFFKLCVAMAIDHASSQLLLIHSPNAYQSLATLTLLYLYFFFDFAGYSHIAVGFGLLLGVKLPENFRQPFRSTTITEFWRNWHISLGDWFRDQIFIPLGGMRLGGLRAAALAGGIMLTCGLWHDVTMPFLCWGLWHGSMIFIEGVSGSRPMPPASRHGPRYWLRMLGTNTRVALGSAFFLPDLQSAFALLKGLLRWW